MNFSLTKDRNTNVYWLQYEIRDFPHTNSRYYKFIWFSAQNAEFSTQKISIVQSGQQRGYWHRQNSYLVLESSRYLHAIHHLPCTADSAQNRVQQAESAMCCTTFLKSWHIRDQLTLTYNMSYLFQVDPITIVLPSFDDALLT